MYESPKYIAIGQILKPTGTKGEVKIDIDDDFFDDIEASRHIFIKIRGSYVPFFIENLRETHQNLILKIEEIDSPEKAIQYNLKEIFLRENEIASPEFFDKKIKQGLENYLVYNRKVLIGPIKEIQLHPQQIIAIVDWNSRDVMVPLVDEWIEKIDEDKATIDMILPEGLLEING